MTARLPRSDSSFIQSAKGTPACRCSLCLVHVILRLNGIAVDCVIGEREDERNRLQRLRVSVALELADTSARTDQLADTVDYAALSDLIRGALVAARCRMIERAAAVVAETCLADPKIQTVRVSVVKAGIVEGLESAEVEYELGR